MLWQACWHLATEFTGPPTQRQYTSIAFDLTTQLYRCLWPLAACWPAAVCSALFCLRPFLCRKESAIRFVAASLAQAMRLLSRLPAAASRGGALRAAVWLQQQQAAPPPGRKLAVLVLARDGKKRRKPQSRDGGGSSSSSDEVQTRCLCCFAARRAAPCALLCCHGLRFLASGALIDSASHPGHRPVAEALDSAPPWSPLCLH